MAKSFIFNDETTKNSHNFFLLNAGGVFERFDKNPVMLDNHNLDHLIGKWENRRIDGSLLIADPVFDDGTERGKERKGQVDRGFLNGASVGIIVLEAEWRANPITNEEDIYVTRWELFEGSTTPVPSNAGALSLKIYDSNRHLLGDNEVELHINNIIKLSLSTKGDQNFKHTKMDKQTLSVEALVALGMNENSDFAAISAAVVSLNTKLSASTEANTTLQKALDNHQLKRAEDLVSLAITEGRITADKKDQFVNLALSDYDMAKTTLAMIPAKATLAGKVTPINAGTLPEARESWTHLKWIKEDPQGLAKLKIESPEIFEQIKQVRN